VSGEDQSLHRLCRNCGHREEDTKGGMVMEMMVQERSAEGYKILLNEFTRQDPRLPHIRKNIKCPEPTCDSNHGKKDPDIIYIKYDAVNMLYLYICDICGFQWRSARS
jgi:DNA-directed RNA polymerase subunit M/transcription elongation factor TFIIS